MSGAGFADLETDNLGVVQVGVAVLRRLVGDDDLNVFVTGGAVGELGIHEMSSARRVTVV
jgi:hypothetical protein